LAANVDATSSAAKYARYIHQIMCSPPASSLLRALDLSEELTTIPSLTTALIKNHLPCSTTTDKGHMHQHQANTGSTCTMQFDIIATRAEVDCMFPPQEICAMQDVFCFAVLADAITGTMYTNITSTFPVRRSFKSMQYMFVAYINDLNAIIVRAMPSCTDASMVQAFTKVISILKSGGYHPSLNVMDNKCSSTVKKYIRSKSINIQLVSPHNYQAHVQTANNLTNSGCTNSEGGCTKSEGGDYSTTKSGYYILQHRNTPCHQTDAIGPSAPYAQ
jgi:hypothetical protein